MDPKIIFENENFAILEKPSGWVVNDSQTTQNQLTLQGWIAKNMKTEISSDNSLRCGIVHRLDKETSGLLIVAKNEESFYKLQEMFKSREVRKTYLALVHGKVAEAEGSINAPVGRLRWNRERFGVLPGGREALTRYRVISNFQFPISKENLTLLELKPETGRTHQIRIHLKFLGHPIVADSFYAGRKTSRKDRKWCPRLFLHARSLSFPDLNSHKNMTFKSDLPVDLKNALDTLEKISD